MVRRNREVAEKMVRAERRRSRRQALAAAAAIVRAGDLTLEGEVLDLSTGGVFIATKLLIEIGERGLLEVGADVVAVQVVWLRGCADGEGPGMGLAFVDDGVACERFHQRLAGG
jgi:PilZ domain